MLQLKKNGLRWLKLFHLAAACCWLGGAIGMLTISLLVESAENGDMLFGIVSASRRVDVWVVIIPGLFGCLLTGLIYGLFTSWGFFRHKWVIVKWVGTLAAFFFGNRFLGQWEAALLKMSRELGFGALQDPEFYQTLLLHRYGGIAQTLVLLLLVGISIFKPWKKRKADQPSSS